MTFIHMGGDLHHKRYVESIKNAITNMPACFCLQNIRIFYANSDITSFQIDSIYY